MLAGNWSDVTCSCSCAGQNLDLQPGFCPDADGACTVPKVYDDGTKTFYCPNGPAPAAQQAPAQNPGAIALDPSCGEQGAAGSVDCDLAFLGKADWMPVDCAVTASARHTQGKSWGGHNQHSGQPPT